MKAFPSNGFYEKTGGGEQPQKLNPVMGMDLRDYFAAQVLPKVMEHWPSASFLGASEIAYDYADAMMKARSE